MCIIVRPICGLPPRYSPARAEEEEGHRYGDKVFNYTVFCFFHNVAFIKVRNIGEGEVS